MYEMEQMISYLRLLIFLSTFAFLLHCKVFKQFFSNLCSYICLRDLHVTVVSLQVQYNEWVVLVKYIFPVTTEDGTEISLGNVL